MSALCMDELTLSQQAAVCDSFARALARKYGDLLNPLASPASLPVTPSAGPFPAGGANPLSAAAAIVPDRPPVTAVAGFFSRSAEQPAMAMQRQLTDHPPLLVCHPGHQARMYETRGDCRVVFHVECCICGVRTDQLASMDAAAEEWAHRRVHPIPQMQKDVA